VVEGFFRPYFHRGATVSKSLGGLRRIFPCVPGDGVCVYLRGDEIALHGGKKSKEDSYK
jgi:hypothetical protein